MPLAVFRWYMLHNIGKGEPCIWDVPKFGLAALENHRDKMNGFYKLSDDGDEFVLRKFSSKANCINAPILRPIKTKKIK